MPRTRSRTVGRVSKVLMIAGPWNGDAPRLDGIRTEIARDGDHTPDRAATRIRIYDSAAELGSMRVTGRGHDDPHLGRYSLAEPAYAYGSQLEVAPEHQNRGLGRFLIQLARHVASDEFDAGFKTVTGTSNAPSIQCHLRAGMQMSDRIFGIRLGRDVIWLYPRSVRR